MDELAIPRKPKVVLPKDPNECWIFQGAITRYGNGQVKSKGKNRTCQRWMFEMLFGALPEEIEVGTTCGNGLCINPYHLVARCHAESIRAGAASVLTPGDLADIRRVPPKDRTAAMADALASRIGCHRRTIQRVWGRRAWHRTRGHTQAKQLAQGVSHG